jgi:predicted outer membrane repeat protein
MRYWIQQLTAVLAWAALPITQAQQTEALLTQQALCPDYQEIDTLQECQGVGSFDELKTIIEEAPPGATIDLCAFFVQTVSSADPIFVRTGIRVRCVRKTPDDICIINGMGHHLWIDTSADTLWQGMSFRGSDDHAVYVAGEVDNAQVATHTFCQSSFTDNLRLQDTRGGAFMAEPSSGTVNIVQCLFSENFSATYGAGIYSRTNQLNVINSIFVKNKANGYGGAIFTASGASLMIRDTTFLSNKSRDNQIIVFNPGKCIILILDYQLVPP